jgi:hypothetical protein
MEVGDARDQRLEPCHVGVAVEVVGLPDAPRVRVSLRVLAEAEALDLDALGGGVTDQAHVVRPGHLHQAAELVARLRGQPRQRVVAGVVVVEELDLATTSDQPLVEPTEPPLRRQRHKCVRHVVSYQ